MGKFRYTDEGIIPRPLSITLHPEADGSRLELRINDKGFLTFDEIGSIYLHQRGDTWRVMGLPVGTDGKILQRHNM